MLSGYNLLNKHVLPKGIKKISCMHLKKIKDPQIIFIVHCLTKLIFNLQPEGETFTYSMMYVFSKRYTLLWIFFLSYLKN